VLAPLADEAFFRTVHLGQFGQIAWSEEIEICSHTAYHQIDKQALVERLL
jgi:hypothetical protein